MPKNKELFYEDFKKQLPVPYVIYADFEALITPAGYEVCSYGFITIRQDNKVITPPQIYRGDHAARKFLDAVFKEQEKIRNLLLKQRQMDLSPEEENDFLSAEICHICEQQTLKYGRKCSKVKGEDKKYLGEAHWKCKRPEGSKRFDSTDKALYPDTSFCIVCEKEFEEDFYEDKVRDYCHITGCYRGAAHRDCNLSFKINQNMDIPIFFHNLKGYDMHIILQGIEDQDNLKITSIPDNTEKYTSLTITNENGGLKFLESFQFTNTSLEKLIANAKKAMKPSEENPNPPSTLPIADLYNIEKRKGVYPYSYMNSWDKFKEENLPPKEKFYDNLKREQIKDEDYQTALEVWKDNNCKTLGDYHDIYLLSDVVLLADIFQGFRKMSLSYYGLDPANFFTAPGLSWSAL